MGAGMFPSGEFHNLCCLRKSTAIESAGYTMEVKATLGDLDAVGNNL
jgi:hypothetical protein